MKEEKIGTRKWNPMVRIEFEGIKRNWLNWQNVYSATEFHFLITLYFTTSYYYYLYTISYINISRSCIGFFENRSWGPRTGHRARPQVADRGALNRGLLLNTDTKLNKQSWKMFQGWSRRNNPQAKVLTTVPTTTTTTTTSLANRGTNDGELQFK